MSKRYFLSLNEAERRILQKIAEANGFKDSHEWLHRQVNTLPKKIKKEFSCATTETRKQKPIQITAEAEVFFKRLACAHSTTELSVVSKFIIYPAILKYLSED